MSRGCYDGYDHRDRDYNIQDMCYESQADTDFIGEDMRQYGQGIPEEDLVILEEEPLFEGDFIELEAEDLENFDPDVGEFPDEDFEELDAMGGEEGVYEEGELSEINEDEEEVEEMYEEENEEMGRGAEDEGKLLSDRYQKPKP